MCAYRERSCNKFRPQTASKLAEPVHASFLSLFSLAYSPSSRSPSLELFYTSLLHGVRDGASRWLYRRRGREASRKSRHLKSTRHFHIDSVVCASRRPGRGDEILSHSRAGKSRRVSSPPSIPRSFDRESASRSCANVKARRNSFPRDRPAEILPAATRRQKKKCICVAIAFSRAKSISRDLSKIRKKKTIGMRFLHSYCFSSFRKRCSFHFYPVGLNHQFLLSRNQLRRNDDAKECGR